MGLLCIFTSCCHVCGAVAWLLHNLFVPAHSFLSLFFFFCLFFFFFNIDYSEKSYVYFLNTAVTLLQNVQRVQLPRR